jgi:CheY-like chemotaxis protein
LLDDDYASKHVEVTPGQYVAFAVSDTGIGMSSEILEKACEPFFTTKREGEGTGLGLSMAFGFVKQSGGHFKIYSEVGQGTTVRMYFPRAFENEAQAVTQLSGPVTGGTETILVVEDDPAVQATAVDVLTSLGYRVLKADDATSALVILKSGITIDLLFTDVVMPGELRSPELARQARILIPGIEVLFTSGYTQNAIVHGGRLDPGVNLISKPYSREQLARKIRLMLADRQQEAAAEEQQSNPPVNKKKTDRSLRILVVEDNHDALHIACELLTLLGYQARGASTAEEAIQLFGAEPFDILFTDFTLPGMNGAELAKRLRDVKPDLRIVVASGYGDSGAFKKELDAMVITKPYDLSKLEEILTQFR